MRLALPISAARGGVSLEPLLIPAFCVLWSLAFAVSKLGLADCPPLLLLTIRFLAAGAITLAGAAMLGANWRLSWHDGFVLAAIGIANNAIYLGFSYSGMRTIPSGLMALIVSMNPVLTALLAARFLGERMTVRKTAGLILGVAGVAIIVESRLAGGTTSLPGIGFAVAALLSLAAGTILFKRFAPKTDLIVANGVQTLAGGVVLVPFAFAVESVGDIVPTWRLLAAFAYLTILGSIVAYLLWFRLLTMFGATAASAYHFMMPPLGMLFGWLLLGEHVNAPDLIGVVPVAAGIWLVTRPAGRSLQPIRTDRTS
jgi:drug/metabolite transporter (DMT)-like permease